MAPMANAKILRRALTHLVRVGRSVVATDNVRALQRALTRPVRADRSVAATDNVRILQHVLTHPVRVARSAVATGNVKMLRLLDPNLTAHQPSRALAAYVFLMALADSLA